MNNYEQQRNRVGLIERFVGRWKADRGGREEGVLSYQYAYSTVKMQVVKIKNVIANTVIYNKIDFKENWGFG